MTDDERDALSKGTVFYRPLLPWEAAETAYWRGVERRARALFSMLISGRIEAYGYNVKDGCENRISPAIWQHHRYFVQPGSGDVFELDPKAGEEGEMVLRWEALTLRKPAMTATAVVTHPTPIAVPTPSRKTCKADAVATAIAAEDLADNNRGLSPKQIAYRIGPRLEEFNFSLEALTKQVSRFYKKNAKAPVSDTRSATS